MSQVRKELKMWDFLNWPHLTDSLPPFLWVTLPSCLTLLHCVFFVAENLGLFKSSSQTHYHLSYESEYSAVSTVFIIFGFWFWRLSRQTSVCTVVNIYLLLCEVFDTLTSKMTFVTFCRRVICCVFGNVTCWQLAVFLYHCFLLKVIFFHLRYFRYLDFGISNFDNFMSVLSFQKMSN